MIWEAPLALNLLDSMREYQAQLHIMLKYNDFQ